MVMKGEGRGRDCWEKRSRLTEMPLRRSARRFLSAANCANVSVSQDDDLGVERNPLGGRRI